MKEKPGDRHVIIGLYKKTKDSKLNWYKLNGSNETVDMWKSSEKLTPNKALSYTIYHRKDLPFLTHLIVHLDKRTYNQKTKKIISSNMIKVRTINSSSAVMLLLRLAMEKSGDEIIRSVVGIIHNVFDPNKLLLVKRHENDRTIGNVWVFPGGKIDDDEKMDDAIEREIIEETNLYPIDIELLKYRNIFEMSGKYYMIAPYEIKDYAGELLDFPTDELSDAQWINKDDLFNYNLGPETLRIVRYLNKRDDKLPF